MSGNVIQLDLIVAVANNGVIGKNGELPWRQSADLKRFKDISDGRVIVCGHETYKSLPNSVKYDPNRHLHVITRNEKLICHQPYKNATICRDFFIAECNSATLDHFQRNPLVIGGAEIYQLALPRVQKIYLTKILAEIPGDTRFPPFNICEWKEISREPRQEADENNQYPYSFHTFVRNGQTCG